MPFLAGGYHLSWPAKLAITNASFIAMAWELSNEREADTKKQRAENVLRDLGAIAQFGGTVYILWVPPMVQASIAARVGVLLAPLAVPAAVLTSTIIVGGVVSYAIDPEEGLQNYKDFISEPTKIPERLKFTAETIYEHKIEPKVNLTLGVASMLWNIAQREYEENPFFKNRYLTGPYLPF